MEDLRVLLLLDLNKNQVNKLLLNKLTELNIWEDKFGQKSLLKEDKDLPDLKEDNKDKFPMTQPLFSQEILASILMNTLYITFSLNVETSFLPELLREKMEEAEDSDMQNSEEKKKFKKLYNWLDKNLMEDQ